MISIIIPFYNEEENIQVLLEELNQVLTSIEHEIILVDDGSTDGSKDKAQSLSAINNRIMLVSHSVRLGKGAALNSGIKAAKGDVVVFMDADLQDDPQDIPAFITKSDVGFDVVNGWRQNRKDTSTMNFISKIGNFLIWRFLLHSKLHDVNCGFKLIKRKVLDKIPLYGDNFRFLPLIAEQKGYKITEIVVNNRARVHGVSKYNSRKAFFGLFDSITTYFIFRFSEKPLHFFGVIGGIFFVVGFIIALYLSYERIFLGVLLYRRPALLFAALLIIVGVQIILTGIVAELIVYLNKKSET